MFYSSQLNILYNHPHAFFIGDAEQVPQVVRGHMEGRCIVGRFEEQESFRAHLAYANFSMHPSQQSV